MGFLEVGTPLSFEDAVEYLDYVRLHGVLQFIEIYKRVKDRKNDILLWGDEVEFHLVRFQPADSSSSSGGSSSSSADTGKRAYISLRAPEVLATLEAQETALGSDSVASWKPEYGSWMVESTPRYPYGGYTSDLRRVESHMIERRNRLRAVLQPGEHAVTMVAFPTFGVGSFTLPPHPPGGPVSESLYVPDAVINPHPRFGTLTANIRKRRGQKVDIRVPKVKNSSSSTSSSGGNNDNAAAPAAASAARDGTKEATPATAPASAPTPPAGATATGDDDDRVHMDCMAFGMGCCCLQVTFQARDIEESRALYDQLAVLSPIFLAISAGCPILHGHLVDTDVRWDTIAGSVDCRTPLERGCVGHRYVGKDPEIQKAAERTRAHGRPGTSRIQKSRYDSISSYISTSSKLRPSLHNDLPREVDEELLELMMQHEAGVDRLLAEHVAHLFIRDPLVIFSERIKIDDAKSGEHFENIQSTNWQTVRWKPPPPELGDEMGWRVEFRSMDIQLSDFENAALTVVIVLVTRVILFFDLNMYIPISKVDENMKTAHGKDALLKGLFYFRKHLVPLKEQCDDKETEEEAAAAAATEQGSASATSPATPDPDALEQMTVEEIFFGKVGVDTAEEAEEGAGDPDQYFPGLFALIYAYLDIIQCDRDTRVVVEEYMDFVGQRIKGIIPTNAAWIRSRVDAHPDHVPGSSVVEPNVAADLVRECVAIGDREGHCKALHGNFRASLDVDARRKVNLGFGYVGGSSASSAGAPGKSPLQTVRLRGGSFRDEVGALASGGPGKYQQCAMIRELVDKYTPRNKRGGNFGNHVVNFGGGKVGGGGGGGGSEGAESSAQSAFAATPAFLGTSTT